MSSWPINPLIYEINTWVWLQDISLQEKRAVTLGSVPGKIWDEVASLNFDAVWLMGVWKRSPACVAISNQHPGNLSDFYRALPDFTPEDNVGSPYAIREYVVDEHLGGPEGLASARAELKKRGVRLILDFVPNHVAHDHPWVSAHPEYFIQGSSEDLIRDPGSFAQIGEAVFACGRDPFYPAWQDVVQVNAFHPGLRGAFVETLSGIAEQCDGVRCDMAMLEVSDVFERTWGRRAGQKNPGEFWSEVLGSVRQTAPDFLFIAEVYWEMEWDLIRLGFDFCYDKRFYDLLENGAVDRISQYLGAELSYQSRMLRFIENHDEQRALSLFQESKSRAAALAVATLPGARLFHEGELEGRSIKIPVFLRRRPKELMDCSLKGFYIKLLEITAQKVFHLGTWQKCECCGWPDNPEYRNLLAWLWRYESEYFLVAINYCGSDSHGKVILNLEELEGYQCLLEDLLSGERYERDGTEMTSPGLYVGLKPWGFHLFRIRKLS